MDSRPHQTPAPTGAPSVTQSTRKRRIDSPLVVDAGLWLVVLMWASTFSLFKVAGREIDPVAFTGLRFAAMVVLGIALLAASRSRAPLLRRDLPALLGSG